MGKKLSAYNLYMRKALKGKMAGKTKAQRKAIFKAAARGWNKGKPRSNPRSRPRTAGSSRSRSTPRRVNTTMGRRRGFSTQKLFSGLRMVALVAPAAGIALDSSLNGTQKVHKGIRYYTGYHMGTGTWSWASLAKGYSAYVGTALVTYGVPKLISFVKGLF